jgi:hypothetical protein
LLYNTFGIVNSKFKKLARGDKKHTEKLNIQSAKGVAAAHPERYNPLCFFIKCVMIKITLQKNNSSQVPLLEKKFPSLIRQSIIAINVSLLRCPLQEKDKFVSKHHKYQQRGVARRFSPLKSLCCGKHKKLCHKQPERFQSVVRRLETNLSIFKEPFSCRFWARY